MTNNRLEEFLKLQSEFMAVIGVDSSIRGANSLEIQDAVSGIVEESVEINREFRKKVPWRSAKPDENVVFAESVDVFFYLLEIWILLGMSADDVAREYHRKLSANILRFGVRKGH